MAITELLLAARARLTDLVLTDGAISELTLNSAGRLRVSAKGGLYSPISASLTNVNDALIADVSDASIIQVHVKNTSATALAAGAFVFEGSVDSTNGSDGTWFSILGARSNTPISEIGTGTLALASATGNGYSWKLAVNSITWFRVRCTTAITAGSTAIWTAIRGSFATEPNPVIPTHAVTGSGTFTVAGSGTFTTAGTVTNTPAAGSLFALTGAASTNATVVKASAGNLFELTVVNPTAATVYVKLYNIATAPSPGTNTIYAVIPVAAGASTTIEYGALGKRFSAGIAIATTANFAVTDATAVAAGVLITATYI